MLVGGGPQSGLGGGGGGRTWRLIEEDHGGLWCVDVVCGVEWMFLMPCG